MALKLKPRKIDASQAKSLEQALQKQEIQRGAPKTLDPNFPVFEIPPGQRVLVYVPKHTVLDENDDEQLRMDRALIHPVLMKNRYSKVRSVAGLTEFGYDEDPFAEVLDSAYELANSRIEQECKALGLDSENKDDKTVKNIRRKHFDEMPIKSAYETVTFPIVVIETGESPKDVILDDDGNPIGTPYWYTISKVAYEKKWEEALENSEDEPPHPGGCLFLLNFPIGSADEKLPLHKQKMNAARDFTVTLRPNVPAPIKKQFSKWNKETEEWDVLKSAQTVVQNLLLEPEALAEFAEELKEYIANLQLSASVADSAAPSALDAGFQVTGDADNETLGVLPEGAVDPILEED